MSKEQLPEWLRPKKSSTVVTRIPKEFKDAIRIRTVLDDCPNETDYLRKLAIKLRPKAGELKLKNLIVDEDDETEN